MNLITLEVPPSDKLRIAIPPFDGLANYRIQYKHEISSPLTTVIKVKLTVSIELWEVGGDNKFKITEQM